MPHCMARRLRRVIGSSPCPACVNARLASRSGRSCAPTPAFDGIVAALAGFCVRASCVRASPLRAAGSLPGPHLFPTLSRRKEAPHPGYQVGGFDVSGVGGEVAMAGHGRCDVVLQHIDHVEEAHP